MPLLADHRKTLRRINWLAVLAAVVCLAAVVLVLVHESLWTTGLVLIGAGAVWAYQGKEQEHRR